MRRPKFVIVVLALALAVLVYVRDLTGFPLRSPSALTRPYILLISCF